MGWGFPALRFHFFTPDKLINLPLNQTDTHMYSLDCSYYTREFPTIVELLMDILESGMDPNHTITRNGKPTGEIAIDLM